VLQLQLEWNKDLIEDLCNIPVIVTDYTGIDEVPLWNYRDSEFSVDLAMLDIGTTLMQNCSDRTNRKRGEKDILLVLEKETFWLKYFNEGCVDIYLHWTEMNCLKSFQTQGCDFLDPHQLVEEGVVSWEWIPSW